MKLRSKHGYLNPFFRWSGGKQRIVRALLSEMPPKASYDQYYEPFLGGGALFFAAGFRKAHLSDVNLNLINAFQQVQQDAAGVYALLAGYKLRAELGGNNGEGLYYQLREEYNEARQVLGVEDAARFIFLLMNNFNGVYRVNQKGKYNVSFGQRAFALIPEEGHLESVMNRLKNVNLSGADFESALKPADHRSFIYLDPPSARNLTHRYSEELFDEAAHQRLANCANDLSQKGAKIMITIADTELTRDLYGLGWLVSKIEIKRKLHSKSPSITQGELILTNYAPKS